MDMAVQSDLDWLLDIQRKLYQWSQANRHEAYRDLWNWVIDKRNLKIAWGRVSTNKGKNTPGIDGVTVGNILRQAKGVDRLINKLYTSLKNNQYHPLAARRKLIPKEGKPGEFRPLGIPTVNDRIVQSAILQIVEPIFEARFYQVSMGFRPGRSVRDAIELIRRTARCLKKDEKGRKIDPPYKWVIEGDIKGCFDNINHHALLNRFRLGVKDQKLVRLVRKFLKSGIMDGTEFDFSQKGTPQGGILSPILANIALSVIEERYSKWVWKEYGQRGLYKNPQQAASKQRYRDRCMEIPVFYPVRYADDFVLICTGKEEEILEEKIKLQKFLLSELGLELSPEKTKITLLTNGFTFLGHHIRLWLNPRWGYTVQALIPIDRQARLRRKIKVITRKVGHEVSLKVLLNRLNPIIRGWGYFYRHTISAGKVFAKMDRFIFLRIFHWLRKKYHTKRWNQLYRKFRKPCINGGMSRWTDQLTQSVQLADIPRSRWDLKLRKNPDYTTTIGEPGA